MALITYGNPESENDLEQIIDLQSANSPSNLSADEMASQGFVTVKHDVTILAEMNRDHKHAIAKEGDKVIAYALVMPRSFAPRIPVLIPMFQKIDMLVGKDPAFISEDYIVMGQICVAKGYRGMGLFYNLYGKLKEQLSSHFGHIVTEVASRNTRSMAAHAKVGFKTVLQYNSDLGERWNIVAWDWK